VITSGRPLGSEIGFRWDSPSRTCKSRCAGMITIGTGRPEPASVSAVPIATTTPKVVVVAVGMWTTRRVAQGAVGRPDSGGVKCAELGVTAPPS